MTGTKISAENPGLTAGAGALPNLTLSGLGPDCGGEVGGGGGGACRELCSGSGSTLKWGCRKLDLGRTKKLKEKGHFLQGGDLFGKVLGRDGEC